MLPLEKSPLGMLKGSTYQNLKMSLRELSTYTLFTQVQLFMLPINAVNVISLYV